MRRSYSHRPDFAPRELDKWFTLIRKRIGGPPGYKRQNARSFWNRDREVTRGIGVASFKMAMPGTMRIGFAARIVLEFDMNEHWYKPLVNKNHEGFVIEQYAGRHSGIGEPSGDSDRTVVIEDGNLDELEKLFVDLYNTQIGPWLDSFDTTAELLKYIQTSFPFNIVLPLVFNPREKGSIRVQVGQSSSTHHKASTMAMLNGSSNEESYRQKSAQLSSWRLFNLSRTVRREFGTLERRCSRESARY